MIKRHLLLNLSATLLAVTLTGIYIGFVDPSSNMIDSAHAATSSKLGDLSSFRMIAVDVANLIDKGDLTGAKNRIKDLEQSWDAAEAGLKPRAASDWHVVDKEIDQALSAVREKTPNATNCKQVLSSLVKTMDKYSAKS